MCVVNLKTSTCDVRIDRRTRWGNPFVMTHESQRDEVCEKYRLWLWDQIQTGKITLDDLAELDGKTLGCHCAPKRCHGDTLSKAARWAAQRLKKENAT